MWAWGYALTQRQALKLVLLVEDGVWPEYTLHEEGTWAAHRKFLSLEHRHAQVGFLTRHIALLLFASTCNTHAACQPVATCQVAHAVWHGGSTRCEVWRATNQAPRGKGEKGQQGAKSGYLGWRASKDCELPWVPRLPRLQLPKPSAAAHLCGAQATGLAHARECLDARLCWDATLSWIHDRVLHPNTLFDT